MAVAYSRMKKHNHYKARLNALISALDGPLPRPTKTAYTTLRQIVQWIPEGLVDRLAREAGADIRKFTAFSHVLALLYGHLSDASSLNEICDAFRLHEPEVTRIRGTVAPKRNIFVVDSTTLQLSLDCIDWARHRRKKAVAKTHMTLNVGSMLPSFACVDTAAHHDSKYLNVLCAASPQSSRWTDATWR